MCSKKMKLKLDGVKIMLLKMHLFTNLKMQISALKKKENIKKIYKFLRILFLKGLKL